MNILKIHCHHLHLHPSLSHVSPITTLTPRHSSIPLKPTLSLSSNLHISLSRLDSVKFGRVNAADSGAVPLWVTKHEEEEEDNSGGAEDLTQEGEVYKKTLRLVECSMFAALGGLAYILSSSLAIENYFGWFFALPIVFTSLRWDTVAARKTMVDQLSLSIFYYYLRPKVATAILLLVLSGPIKALVYLLQHGVVGLAMGYMWRLRASWGLSVFLSTLVRAVGAVGYVLVYSFLIKDNILALITINIHASITFILSSIGSSTIPSMNLIFTLFGTLVVINCSFFVFLLHILYALFFTRLGMKESLNLPRWLQKAI